MGAHYLTFIMAFSGIYVKNYDPNVPFQIYVVVLLGLVCALTVAKIIIVIVKSIKSPINYNSFNNYSGKTVSYKVKGHVTLQ